MPFGLRERRSLARQPSVVERVGHKEVAPKVRGGSHAGDKGPSQDLFVELIC
jgi:hypothetical protein